MKSTVFPFLGIVLIGSIAGLGFNGVRGKGGLKLTRSYFATIAPVADGSAEDSPGDASGQAESDTKSGIDNPLPNVTLDEMVDFYLSEDYGLGTVLFVDARDDAHFAEAHIPGALHIDRYDSDQYFDKVRDAILVADKIVVYCGGGECEDSIYLASELVMDRDIDRDKVLVFEGGIAEWLDDGLEVEEGGVE